MNKNLNCSIADMQKEVFDNLCKPELDRKLQNKFGNYADIICNTKATEDGGETYLAVGIYDLSDSIVNFSEELSKRLNLPIEDIKVFIEKYIDIFNMSLDVEYDEELNKKNIIFYTESPYTDEFTEQEVLDIIKYSAENSIDKKIVIIIKDFMDNFMNYANKKFGFSWQGYAILNPEF